MKITDMHGETVESLKKILHIDMQAASRYIKAFNEGGIEKLLSYKKSTGRPSILSEQEKEILKEMLQLTPEEAGLGISVNWNSIIVRDFIEKEFGKKMTKSAVIEMLHQMGFSFTRQTYVLTKADKKNR